MTEPEASAPTGGSGGKKQSGGDKAETVVLGVKQTLPAGMRNTARANQILHDNARWENNLLERSGVTVKEGAQFDMEEEEERIRLIVKVPREKRERERERERKRWKRERERKETKERQKRDEGDRRTTCLCLFLFLQDLRPPFLDGRVVFTTQTEAVPVVKDPSSDMAQIARAGSAAVAAIRIKRERQKTTQKFWVSASFVFFLYVRSKFFKDVAGSKIGAIMGVKEEERVDGDDLDVNQKKRRKWNLLTL
jgi:hypothetical protein